MGASVLTVALILGNVCLAAPFHPWYPGNRKPIRTWVGTLWSGGSKILMGELEPYRWTDALRKECRKRYCEEIPSGFHLDNLKFYAENYGIMYTFDREKYDIYKRKTEQNYEKNSHLIYTYFLEKYNVEMISNYVDDFDCEDQIELIKFMLESIIPDGRDLERGTGIYEKYTINRTNCDSLLSGVEDLKMQENDE